MIMGRNSATQNKILEIAKIQINLSEYINKGPIEKEI
jgi:hypothetical protein